jgi:class 3 adenylate cyclase/CHASE2 domain-containing sensor protein
VIVLDLMFARPDLASEDAEFHRAIESAGNVAIAAVAVTVPLDRTADPTLTTDVQLSQPLFADVAAVGSPVLRPRDEEYALELRQTTENADTGELEDYYALAWEVVCLAENRMPDEIDPFAGSMVDGNEPRLLGSLFSPTPRHDDPAASPGVDVEFKVDRGSVQMDEAFYRKQVLINFAGEADNPRSRFPLTSLSQLLRLPDRDGRARFGGKIVMLGNTAQDQHLTAMGAMPGTEVLANAVSTLLSRRPLRVVPAGWVLALSVIVATLSLISLREAPRQYGWMFVPAFAVGYVLLAQYLIAHDWWLLTVTPLTAAAIAALPVVAFENPRIRAEMSRFVPARIARAVERAGGFIIEEGTVLFSDIRGYTTLSEKLEPAEVMECLNRYMASVDRILQRYQGHFVKSPGDCVVAYFAEERRSPDHRTRAICAGLELLSNAREFAEAWRRDTGLDFAVGVGINSGPMAVGLLEAQRHTEPTVIGDTVNSAARIESLTSQYGPLLVSEETLAPVRDAFDADFIQEVSVKGRAKPVRLYGVRGVLAVKSRRP